MAYLNRFSLNNLDNFGFEDFSIGEDFWVDKGPVFSSMFLGKGAVSAEFGTPLAAAPIAVFELSSLLAVNGGDGSAGFILNGVTVNDFAGHPVTSLGDVNDDGIDDFLIGAGGVDLNGTSSGASYVVFGSAGGFPASIELSSLDGTNGFVINGVSAGDGSSNNMATPGDFNGDGINDILIGGHGVNLNGSDTGASYVIYGSGDGFAASIELSNLDGTNGFVLNGINSSDNAGLFLSSAGDVNGDGIDDIFIGAWLGDPHGTNSGESYIVFGSHDGFPAEFELSSLLAANGGDGSAGFIINGIATDDRSGFSVNSAGDVNGDGIDDIILDSRLANTANGSDSGESYVIFGRDTSITPFAAILELSALNGTDGFAIAGLSAGDQSGYGVASAGDINGDGYDDVVIGSPLGDPNGSNSGEAFVVFGKGTPFSADFDLSTLDGTNGFILNGINTNDQAGLAVSGIGDVNGDGYDDIIISAFLADANGTDSGEAYVIFGSGLPFAASLDLSALDGENGFLINGIDAGDQMGVSVSGAGDVNNDGYDDILIGGRYGDTNGFNSGEAYIIFGSAELGRTTTDLTVVSDTYVVAGGGEIVHGLSGVDTITGGTGSDFLFGDGGADILDGGAGNDRLDGGANNDTLDGGAGIDALSYDSAGAGVTVGLWNAAAQNTVGAGIDTVSNFENLTGSAFDDTLTGSGTDNVLRGGDGIDELFGRSGDDTLYGGAGDDSRLDGGAGNDTIYGGAGDDTMFGQLGDDILFGGVGDDFVSGSDGADILWGQAGVDLIIGGNGDDIIDGGTGIDRVVGGFGNDIVRGGTGDDRVFGQAGNDVLEGGDGNDYMSGELGNDIFTGGNGDDRMFGSLGTDTLSGGAGNDNLNGGADNDRIDGGDGADLLTGGTGEDVFAFDFASASTARDTIFDFAINADTIEISGGLVFADLTFTASPNGQHTTVSYMGHEIFVKNTTIAELDTAQFTFIPLAEAPEVGKQLVSEEVAITGKSVIADDNSFVFKEKAVVSDEVAGFDDYIIDQDMLADFFARAKIQSDFYIKADSMLELGYGAEDGDSTCFAEFFSLI